MTHILYKKYAPLFILVGAGLLLYGNTTSFGIVALDDSKYVIANYPFNRDISNIATAFRVDIDYPSGYSIYYRPFQAISHIIDAQLSGAAPWAFHVTNIILHIANTILLFSVFQKLGHERIQSFVFSLLFLVHPAVTGATAWIPGRVDTILALFTLASFYFFIRFCEQKKARDLVFHAIFLAFAFFSKELAIVIPPLMAFYFFIHQKKIKYKNIALLVGVWIFVFLTWFILWRTVAGGTGSLPFTRIAKLIIANSSAFLLYLGKMLLPFNLSALPTLQDSSLWYGIVTLILLILGVLTGIRRISFVIFGTAWEFLFLAPSFYTDDPSSVSIFMEHRAYLPLIGFLFIVQEIKYVKSRYALIVATIIIFIYAGIAYSHSLNFRDRLSFWAHAAQSSPTLPKAHNGFGAALYLQGRNAEAETEYKKAIELNDNEWRVHNNLGLLYTDRKELEAAEKEFQKELEVYPLNADAHLNLGVLYYGYRQDYEKGREHWEKALALNPVSSQAHEYLAAYYYQQTGNIEESIRHIKEALRISGRVQPALEKILKEYERNRINR